jgi:multisubunit Na+/H+ antiporter MnhF subunit
MIIQLTMSLLIISALILTGLLFRAKSIWDKLIFLNLINVKLALTMTAYSVWVDSQMILDISMAYGLIGFLSTATLTRFLLKGGHLK